MTRLRPIAACFVATAVVALSAAPGGAEELRQEFRQLYDLGAGATVSVRNTNGSLDIAKWKGDQVLVEATKTVEALGRSRVEAAMEALRIAVNHSGTRLEIRTELPENTSGALSWLFGRQVRARVSYRIRVPGGIAIRALTVNGNITVEAIDGKVDAETTNGQIVIRGAQASTIASTLNGSIRADFGSVSDAGEINFRTTNGAITVYAPHDLGCSVDASSVHGSVTTDFLIVVQREHGRKQLRGDINGGGRRLSLRTVNGSIQLRKKDRADRL
ncbi:MAG: DUF4097 family beta strand repeat-containing protein [Acidobacteria bacterium]|nr:DUF4097 family beta strand repeat-containing protein [Acidobacteriota bacterium]